MMDWLFLNILNSVNASTYHFLHMKIRYLIIVYQESEKLKYLKKKSIIEDIFNI